MAKRAERDDDDRAEAQRLDKWLWYARVTKTRTLAATLVQNGKVRVNRERTLKPRQQVKADDVVTIAVHGRVRVLRVLAPGQRRGPAKEAVDLYEEISLEASGDHQSVDGRNDEDGRSIGASRPTKRDRRAIDRLKGEGTID